MADTPFELYEEAYRLHYREWDLPAAVRIYEAIVRDFPDASECGYAFIQLQKIKANETTARLAEPQRERRPRIPVLPALVTACVALLLAFGGLLVTLHKLQIEHDRSTLAVAALARIAEGKELEAAGLIDKLRTMDPSDELVSELTNATTACLSARMPPARPARPAALRQAKQDRPAPATAPARPNPTTRRF